VKDENIQEFRSYFEKIASKLSTKESA